MLSRGNKVRRCGNGYIMQCAAHEDRSASLSACEGPDGRVLLHCFAGCSVGDVVHALGLQFSDLYPPRTPLRDMTPAERSAMRQAAKEAQWAAALNVLAFETTVVRIAAADVRAGRALSDADAARVDVAAERIDAAREVLNAR